jgi:hypothetical protein
MGNQGTLTLIEEAAKLANEEREHSRVLGRRAAQRALAAAPTGWELAARAAILGVAANRPGGFTADDVWATGLAPPPEPRALGGVMQAIAKERTIRKTGRFVATTRGSRHGAPVAVWEKTPR